MIVFSGVVSDEIQAKTMKIRHQSFFRLYAIGSGVIIIINGILWFLFWRESIREWIILSGALLAVVILLGVWNPRKKLPFRWEYNITIDSENIVVESPIWPNPLQKPMKKIKKVLDAGDCYYIIYADINNCIVCQKNLIQEGTIEEFEALFPEKIVRQKA